MSKLDTARCEGANCGNNETASGNQDSNTNSADNAGTGGTSDGKDAANTDNKSEKNQTSTQGSPAPTPTTTTLKTVTDHHRIFVTNALYNGKLGGLGGADKICTDAAVASGYGGAWKAVLSDENTNAKDRLVLNKPIKNTQGQILANNGDEFWGGKLQNPVLYDENGKEVAKDNFGFFVWSGSEANGVYDKSWFIAIVNNQNTYIKFACSNWTSDVAANSGNAGYFYAKDSQWVAARPIFYEFHQCSRKKHLYCISQ